MALSLELNGSPDAAARYVGWAPTPCALRQTGGVADLDVDVTSRAVDPTGGEAVFYGAIGSTAVDTLRVHVPADGTPADFFVGGRFGKASTNDRDCLVVATPVGDVETTFPLMVRVRKNANGLASGERTRFLGALRGVNTGAGGVYQVLRGMHVDVANDEEHGGPHFLPWHRAYLLDLEREMQRIDPTVSLHYWRFDQRAENVFTSAFMGATAQVPRTAAAPLVGFDPGHPLSGWTIDSAQGIRRGAVFDTRNQAASGAPGFPVLTEAQTLALGSRYGPFSSMEGTPHGAAHVSFVGSISAINTAPRDPLFFLLHSNVDRLWALWQWLNKRMDPQAPDSYEEEQRDGRRLDDTLWPWNDVRTFPRPGFAPRGAAGLAPSPHTESPGARPVLGALIDYQGVFDPDARIGVDYDDVPYEPELGAPIP